MALLLFVACKTPATKAAKARDELASWAATGAMLSRDWADAEAQTPYVKSTAEVASEAVDKLRDTLNDRASIDELAGLYRKLSAAIARNDRAAAGELEKKFGDISKRLQKSS